MASDISNVTSRLAVRGRVLSLPVTHGAHVRVTDPHHRRTTEGIASPVGVELGGIERDTPLFRPTGESLEKGVGIGVARHLV
ncbi:hypothetical protein ABZY93_11205, partial [Streptomyces smyrnaeus]|uniref:hypothetical protein n=1 Tax=Streptomyces smyrnaeus TaxID=1387713 RepID=UPI0033A7638E